jgi:signal transduction histidine kinase
MSAPSDSEPGREAKLNDQESRDRELSDFLLRMCHDLRSPVRAIRANAELIEKDSAPGRDPRLDEQLGFITSGIRNVELLADGIASYSLALRIETSSFQPVQMDVLLRLVLAKLRKELQAASAEATYDPLPRVQGNPDRLSQVFENLILNAVRHKGPDAPRIHVWSERAEEAWRFAVRDNGPGIEAAYLERIFKPFERLRGKQMPGPGMGLAIAREIVERHGGRIWADSQGGTGTTFFFTLPAS